MYGRIIISIKNRRTIVADGGMDTHSSSRLEAFHVTVVFVPTHTSRTYGLNPV